MLWVPSPDAIYFRVTALDESYEYFSQPSPATFHFFYSNKSLPSIAATLLSMQISEATYMPPWRQLLSSKSYSNELFTVPHNEHKTISRCIWRVAFHTSVVFTNWTESFECNMFLINCQPLPNTAEHLCSAWNVPKVSFSLNNIDRYEPCNKS